ncbi:MAG TPA: ATP-binding domain-containing protein [Polyangiaceae bacterium]
MSDLGPQERKRVEEELAVTEAVRRHFPDERTMYVARLSVVRDNGEALDVFFGSGAARRSSSWPSAELVDWQRSPWTRVLLSSSEGDPYEIRSRGDLQSGRIERRAFLRFDGGELVEIAARGQRFARRGDGSFVLLAPAEPTFSARPAVQKKRPRSLIDVDLDPAQKSAVTLPADRSVLLLGEAGYGKTTVALHRLRHLIAAAEGPFRAAVVVPTEGLKRLIQPLLRRLGIDVEAMLYDEWAREQAVESFPDIPAVESQNATSGVIRIKRDPALRVILARLAERRAGRRNNDRDTRQKRTTANVRHADLQHLFGDSVLMHELASTSKQRITAAAVSEVLEHTHVQFSERAEKEYAHVVDRKRLVAVDGRSIDEGTPLEDAGTIDAEDYAVLFELDRLRAERRKKPPVLPTPYDCILLDEAQELAPLELALIGRSLSPTGALIVAGDADQQVDPDVAFQSWETTMSELAVASYERVVLEVGYRCPPGVVALGRAALGRGEPAPVTMPREGDGARPVFRHFDNELFLAEWLITELADLARRDRRATACIICRSPLVARRLATTVRFGIAVSLVLDGRFLFGPTSHVTTVEQVKGLEFDYIVVPDASTTAYPDEPAARRAMYVAATRARHQLVLASVGPRTTILDPATIA